MSERYEWTNERVVQYLSLDPWLFQTTVQCFCSMDRGKVTSDFGGVSSDLLHIRKELSLQIKRETESIKEMENHVKRRKAAVLRLTKQKQAIERTIINVSDIRRNLVYITNEKVLDPTWSSTSDLSALESNGEELVSSSTVDSPL